MIANCMITVEISVKYQSL